MITVRQLEVLRAIEALIAEHGWAPSIEELGALVGLTSKSTTSAHLDALVRHGLIVRGPGARQLRLTEAGRYEVLLAAERALHRL